MKVYKEIIQNYSYLSIYVEVFIWVIVLCNCLLFHPWPKGGILLLKPPNQTTAKIPWVTCWLRFEFGSCYSWLLHKWIISLVQSWSTSLPWLPVLFLAILVQVQPSSVCFKAKVFFHNGFWILSQHFHCHTNHVWKDE